MPNDNGIVDHRKAHLLPTELPTRPLEGVLPREDDEDLLHVVYDTSEDPFLVVYEEDNEDPDRLG